MIATLALPTFDDHVLRIVLKEEYRMSQEEIEADIQDYREFWMKRKLYPDSLEKPSLAADRVWHTHIIQTEAYAEDCDNYFGYFLHHASLMCHGGGGP